MNMFRRLEWLYFFFVEYGIYGRERDESVGAGWYIRCLGRNSLYVWYGCIYMCM